MTPTDVERVREAAAAVLDWDAREHEINVRLCAAYNAAADSASADKYWDIAKEYQAHLSTMRVSHEDNMRLARAALAFAELVPVFIDYADNWSAWAPSRPPENPAERLAQTIAKIRAEFGGGT